MGSKDPKNTEVDRVGWVMIRGVLAIYIYRPGEEVVVDCKIQ